MDYIKRLLSNLDGVLLLTVLAYGVVYAFNLGGFAQREIPSMFIELNINSLSSGLFFLGLFVFIFSPITIQSLDARDKPHKIVLIIILLLAIAFLYYTQEYFLLVNTTLVLGIVIIIFSRNIFKRKFMYLITIAFFCLIGSYGMGYVTAYVDLHEAEEQYIIEKNNEKYLLLGSYNNNYIATKINNKDNSIEYKYILIPVSSDESSVSINLEKIQLKIND
ncbi:hypothetical protein [Niallia taxi]|uniref:Uncharacterized protein n=1 Tax=Niallia taxi TaxID=2499688 RepID=A0A437KHC6_9BACI|nr:hypothetical protein [Niallia taxi]RVT67672.1 hypothetical protein EM808_04135 [Niallia taxi]